MTRLGLRILTFMASGFALMTLTSQSACAAGYDVTGPSPGSGSGRVQGSASFASVNSFTYNMTATDLCPIDGYGVAGDFEIEYTNGSFGFTPLLAWDRDGCGNGGDHQDSAFAASKEVRAIRVQIIFCHDGEAVATSVHMGSWIDNPNN